MGAAAGGERRRRPDFVWGQAVYGRLSAINPNKGDGLALRTAKRGQHPQQRGVEGLTICAPGARIGTLVTKTLVIAGRRLLHHACRPASAMLRAHSKRRVKRWARCTRAGAADRLADGMLNGQQHRRRDQRGGTQASCSPRGAQAPSTTAKPAN